MSIFRECRVCGCTDNDACAPVGGRNGLACSWVADDICSACVPARPRFGAPTVAWPIYTGFHELQGHDGLGIAVARAFRESA